MNSTLFLMGLVFLMACSSLAEDFAVKAAALNMERGVMAGANFQHVIYTKAKAGALSKTLHIYLDGDGTPWLAGRPSADPTPSNPMVLNLMALDSASAVYVGRPCYHGAKSTVSCSSDLWLKDRYSEKVVASLSVVIKELLARGGYENIAWFGHSGGGTLAVLLASRFAQTKAVVTVAANLDVDAWVTAAKNHKN